MDEEVNTESLKEYVEFLQKILLRHPDARVWSYESTIASAYYEQEENMVITS